MKIYYITIILSAVVITGCRKFVEINPPTTQLVTSSVFANDETAISALTGVYSTMVNTNTLPYMIPLFTGLSGDELMNYATSVNHDQLYLNSLKALDAPSNRLWTAAYSVIYQANAAYEGCANSNLLSPAVKKQLMAEALFIRAYWHFYLVNLYGDIPLVISSDYLINSRLSRSSSATVYAQIISDLKTAQADLNENYVALNSISTSTDRIRPNKSVATALLARVYLYMKNYQESALQATLLIDNKSTYRLEPIGIVFQKNSKEAIWQIMKPLPSSDVNTWEGYYFTLQTVPQSGFQNSSAISTQLLASFETGDLRKSSWIAKFTSTTSTPNVDYFYPSKYKVRLSSTVSEHSVVLRLAEQYLIRAEARVYNGDIPGAIADVDSLRKRSGLPLISDQNPGISKDNLLTVIMKERQTELFGEWGHRWFDLKRTGNIDAVMTIVTPLKGGGVWKTTKQLWPIPQKERQNNNNLSQNLDYN